MKADEAKLLSAIEKKYGVDRHILLGIWGMESNFGKDKGSMKRDALARHPHLFRAAARSMPANSSSPRSRS